jgi:ABC-type nickel/cobalt efflux system permease component RcnA
MTGVIFLIVVFIICLASLFIMWFTNPNNELIMGPLVIIFVLAGITFLTSIIAIPVIQMSASERIIGFEETRRTIQEAREGKTAEIETVGLTKLIAEKNAWLAREKESNKTWDWWHSDEIEKVSPLK